MWGSVILLVWDLLKQQLINYFRKIQMVLKRTFKSLTEMVLKRTNWRLSRCFTPAAVWHQLTAEEADAAAGLVTADVLAV